jgi:hypothetical protein
LAGDGEKGENVARIERQRDVVRIHGSKARETNLPGRKLGQIHQKNMVAIEKLTHERTLVMASLRLEEVA